MVRQVKISSYCVEDLLYSRSRFDVVTGTNKRRDRSNKGRKTETQENELICQDHNLNALSDRLYDLYRNTTSTNENWNDLKSKYKAKEEDTKKILFSKYFDFKFLENILLFPQLHELQVIVNKLNAMKFEILETFQVGL